MLPAIDLRFMRFLPSFLLLRLMSSPPPLHPSEITSDIFRPYMYVVLKYDEMTIFLPIDQVTLCRKKLLSDELVYASCLSDTSLSNLMKIITDFS